MNTYIDTALSAIVDEELNGAVKADLIKHYNEPWRHFHTMEHINDMFTLLDKEYVTELDKRDLMKIRLAILFHDVIYLPWADDNEIHSAYYFLESFKVYTGNATIEDPLTLTEAYEIRDAIMNSKWDSSTPPKQWQRYFIEIDRAVLANPSIDHILGYEKKIYKEFQFVPHDVYKTNRTNFLLSAIKFYDYDHLSVLLPKTHNSPGTVKIGMYCGSFDPFHKGHFNILEQAEKVFDKVVIVVTSNLKTNEEMLARMEFIFKSAPGREIIYHSGPVSDLIKQRTEDVTIIKGFRNGNDIENATDEQDIKIVYFKCDNELSNLTSDAVKELLKTSKESPSTYFTCDRKVPITEILKEQWKKSLTI